MRRTDGNSSKKGRGNHHFFYKKEMAGSFGKRGKKTAGYPGGKLGGDMQ
jgi:hypothetical protein